MRASIIISFYNKVDWLKLVLMGFERQSCTDFEVIIADDGSHKEAVEELLKIKNEVSFPIQHIWQKDDGWRKNRILNKAIVAAKSEYLIFIDGDCISHRHFVREHLRYKGCNILIEGRRIDLSKNVTTYLTTENVKGGFLERNAVTLSIWGKIRDGSGDHIEKGIYAPRPFHFLFPKKGRGIWGHNFSIHKADMLAINGFDESYASPAIGEDSDIQMRLEFNGVTLRSIKYFATQYHLYHKKVPKTHSNAPLMEKRRKRGLAFTPDGIVKQIHQQ